MDSYVLNENGKTIEVVRGSDFQVGPRYTNLNYLGEGSYGMVCSALDTVTNRRVAIKRISPFEHQTICQRTYREIKLLKMYKHENIIFMYNIFTNDEFEHMKNVYLVQVLMETDLQKLLTLQTLTMEHISYFTYQIFRGLKYIHSANIIHRDLKPSNLLINSNCDLRICDFGLARSVQFVEDMDDSMTEYVATRWYRAPEVMLNSKNYTLAIDIWSVGCIFVEMFNGQPLFPGKHYLDQLNLILHFTGSPSVEDKNDIKNPKARIYLDSMPQFKKKSVCEVVPSAKKHGIDLISKMLEFNAAKRITAECALSHEFLKEFHDENDEPNAPFTIAYEAGSDNVPREQLKRLVWEEIKSFVPQN